MKQPKTEISLELLLKITKWSDRHVRRLSREGAIPKPDSDGNYPAVETLSAVIRYLQDQPKHTAELKRAQVRLTNARAKKFETDAKKKEGPWMVDLPAFL